MVPHSGQVETPQVGGNLLGCVVFLGLVKFNTKKNAGTNKHVLRIFEVLLGFLFDRFSDKNAVSMEVFFSFCPFVVALMV